MIQGSPEWHQARLGKVTASRVHDVVATTKSGGYTAGRKNYLSQLVRERLTGVPTQSYQSAAMLNGSELEPEARFAYALDQGVHVTEVGFIPHPTILMAGASPDGLVGDVGLVEIKCPSPTGHVHIDNLLGDKIPLEYISQIQFQLAVTEREWCDLVSYDRTMPPEMQVHVVRLHRVEKIIDKMEEEVRRFLADVHDTVDLLRKRFLPVAA
jgi:putative phage-type endonuclease